MRHAIGGSLVAIRKPGPHNGGGQVGTLKWWRQSVSALEKLSSKLWSVTIIIIIIIVK